MGEGEGGGAREGEQVEGLRVRGKGAGVRSVMFWGRKGLQTVSTGAAAIS